jgi:cation diffusion facilitator family transporter
VSRIETPIPPDDVKQYPAQPSSGWSHGHLSREEMRASSREKNWAAATSMLAAVVLTIAKLTVALLTGSLGIFSEAMHSGMDLVGTALSFAAVRISSRPPDATHPYGHAKFESLAALFAVFLLAITSVGILREAFERVFETSVVPTGTFYGVGVLLLSILVDFTRSRYLKRVAKKHGSQALAADAAHFETDLYSSITVLLGLGLVAYGGSAGWSPQWLAAADALAGASVAVIILIVAGRLALRAVNSLTDRVPPNLVDDVVAAASQAPGTLGDPSARVRFLGDQAYADVSIGVPRGLSLERSRAVSEEVVAKVQDVLPRADVVVRAVPVAPEAESAVQAATVTAARLGLGIHHVRAFQTPLGLRLDMHMEVPSHMTLGNAHEQADRLEAELAREIAGVNAQVHIEPRHEDVHTLVEAEQKEVRRLVEGAVAAGPHRGIHDIEVLQSEHGYVVTLHCYLPADMPIAAAHNVTAEIERVIREQVPGIYRITVHPEPATELHIP